MKSAILAAVITGVLVSGSPITAPSAPNGNGINVIFFSDAACKDIVPASTQPQHVSYAVPCYNSHDTQTYNSLKILHINDRLIGTNSALQVGNVNEVCFPGEECDFTSSIKFNIANRKTVNQCQHIGIPMNHGTVGGNEYRLTTLQ